MKKRNRINILIDLIRLNGNLVELKSELLNHSFNSKAPLLKLTKIDFYYVLNECILKNITINEFVEWLNIIEYRDDLDIEDELVAEFIFDLSSPEINGEITTEKLIKIMKQLDFSEK